MKPFNLQAALAGEPVKLRNGEKAFVIKKLLDKLDNSEVLIGYRLTTANEYEDPLTWAESGSFFEDCDADMRDIVGMWEDQPKTIKIGDIYIPEPEREPLKIGEPYYVPYITYSDISCLFQWDGGKYDLRALKRGLVHKTREAAEQHAKALIALTASDEA